MATCICRTQEQQAAGAREELRQDSQQATQGLGKINSMAIGALEKAMDVAKAEAQQRDGTIPLSEALEALARGEAVEWGLTAKPYWEPLTDETHFSVGYLRQKLHRFRIAPPSRLKALVAKVASSRDAETGQEYADRIAQAVTRDVCTYLREQAPSAPWHSAALLVERAYLGSK